MTNREIALRLLAMCDAYDRDKAATASVAGMAMDAMAGRVLRQAVQNAALDITAESERQTRQASERESYPDLLPGADDHFVASLTGEPMPESHTAPNSLES